MPEPLFGVFEASESEADTGWEAELSEFVGAEPVETFKSFERMLDWLDNNDGDFFWREARLNEAEEKVVCSICEEGNGEGSIVTNSEERVRFKKEMHHYDTGH